jgi:hypothetical protein
MLMHVSNGAYLEGAKVSERFIVQVGILFDCIDSLEKKYIHYGDESEYFSNTRQTDSDYLD